MFGKNKVTELFSNLVSFDAESYEERKIGDYVIEKLKELGLEVFEDKVFEEFQAEGKVNAHTGNIYGTLRGTCPGSPILFSAHLDTVSPGRGKQAVFSPDGRITSGGETVLGADDVAGMTAIIAALEEIIEEQLPHPDIEVLFCVAEEAYARGSRGADYARLQAKEAYVFDLSGNVGTAAVAAPTILSLEIKITGKSAHAGFCPEQGVHAIKIVGESLSQIRMGKIDSETTVNIGTIQGGVAKNIVPDICTVTGEIRSLDHEKAFEQYRRIADIFQKTADIYCGAAETSIKEEFQAYHIDNTEKVVKMWQSN